MAVRHWYLYWLEVDVLVYLAPLVKYAGSMIVMTLAIWGQQKRVVMSRLLPALRGWWMECDWKTGSLIWMGTSGPKSPVKTFPIKEAPQLSGM
jgi:hypothetical protein